LYGAKDEHGITKPFFLPPVLALKIVMALRGEISARTQADGMHDEILVPR
jgi:hypothetical protein